jgi:mRNA interferase RelE/StbE
VKLTAELSGSATRYLGKLDAQRRAAIVARVEALSGDYRAGSKPLQGALRGTWAARVGEFRILFEVDDGAGVLRVVKVGPRGDVYKL